MITLEYVKDYFKIARCLASRIDNSYTPLYIIDKGCIVSSVVPPVKVNDPIVQQMVDDISSVLRGVDEKYFPVIRYVNAERRGDQYILLFAAEGKGFRLGVVCGTDGSVSGFQLIANRGKYKTKVHSCSTPDDIRRVLEEAGSILSRRK